MLWQPDWRRLFPAADFRFHLGVHPADPPPFFQPSPTQARVLAERRHWLALHPDRYAALDAAGEHLLEETIELARAWQVPVPSVPADPPLLTPPTAASALLALGCAWEPDVLLLAAQADGHFRLAGGVTCFPSSWALTEKLGLTVSQIHAVVPELNPALGRNIDAFLQRVGPASWGRLNWGLSPDAELNRHPARRLPALPADARPESTWVRIEHQLFVRLPRTRGLLFGIRVTVHPLAEVLQDSAAGAGFIRALETMPDKVAAYKSLTAARPALLRSLTSGATPAPPARS